jgi:CheY-like chemotaxis protein
MGTQSPAPVLVVGDDEDIRYSLRSLLEDARHPVAEAVSTNQAIIYLRATPVGHVVLLDFLMPGGDADILLRAVKRGARLRRHCYVLIPATRPESFSQEAQRLIADVCVHVVLKPFDVDDVLRAVDTAAALLGVSLLHRFAARTRALVTRRR